MATWDRPSDFASALPSSAFDANRFATTNLDSHSSASAPAFFAPVFEPPPSFDFDSSSASSAAPLPPVIAGASSSYSAPADHESLGSPSDAALSPAAVQLTSLGNELTADGDVRSIAAFAHRSAPNRIVRFEFKLHNGKHLFAPQHVKDNGDELRPAGRWDLLDGETLASAYVLTNPGTLEEMGRSAWIFETSARRISIVFGASFERLSVRTFECEDRRAVIGIESLHLNRSSGSSGALPPITHARQSKKTKLHTTSSLLSVDTAHGPSGVELITFTHQAPHSNCNESFGSRGSDSTSESFRLDGAGTVHAEVVTEVICVQGSTRLHAVQFVSNRGRRSEWILRGEWRAFRSESLARTVHLVGEELEQQLQELIPIIESRDFESIDRSAGLKAFSGLNGAGADSSDVAEGEAAEADDERSALDINCDDDNAKWCATSISVYIIGAATIALFVYGCTATAYSYSYGTTLGVWLGVFMPLALIFAIIGAAFTKNRRSMPALCAGTWIIGLIVGLIGGIHYLAPWWMLQHLDTAYNVDAAALDFIGNNTQPTSGIFHFQPTAFVNQALVGSSIVRGKGGRTFYCTAPIVTSLTQARVVYWVTDFGSCCAASVTSCWNAVSSPGSIDGAYLQVRRPEYISSAYSDARAASCARLATLNSTYSAASICSLPTVYLTLAASPEAERDSLFVRGMTYVGVMTGLWPLVFLVVAFVFIGMITKKRR